MKNLLLLPVILFVGLTLALAQPSNSALSAEEVFEKVIQYYDPDGIWEKYEGSMHLYSIFANAIGEEELTINNATDYYQSIRLRNDTTFAKGIKEGKIFFTIDKKNYTLEDLPEHFQKQPYNLSEQNVKMMSEHHHCHFSLPLTLHAAGAKPLPEVGKKNLFGTDCLAIKFEGLPNNYPQGGYNGPITLYINAADNYKLHGALHDNGWGKDQKGMLTVYSGEIEIEGLKIPARRVFFQAADQSYNFVDAFAPLEKKD